MIRDFLDHLLLDLRVEHYENLKTLALLDKERNTHNVFGNPRTLPGPELRGQMRKYMTKYSAFILAAHVINELGATDEDIHMAAKAHLRANVVRLDEQIGHLEALQGLFNEALTCVKRPCTPGDIRCAWPARVFKVQDLVEELSRHSKVDLTVLPEIQWIDRKHL